MVKKWDDGMKRLFWVAPQDFASWLMPGAKYIESVSVELKNQTRTILPDKLDRIEVEEEMALLHVEFQKRADPDMANRVWEYNVLATLQYKCPVYSFVIYPRPVSGISEPEVIWGLKKYPPVHDFHFTNIKLWELPQEALRETGLMGLLPLLILTKDGQQRKVAEEVFDELREAGKNELLSVALLLAGLIFTNDSDQRWLERRSTMLEDILRDSWVYQDILKKGMEEGREEGREEGLQTMRLTILDIVQARFPKIVDIVEQELKSIHDPMLLRRLTFKMSTAKNAHEASRALFRLTQRKEDEGEA